jgi:hypothetical protein
VTDKLFESFSRKSTLLVSSCYRQRHGAMSSAREKTMRKSRLKVEETAYYHCMSRVIEQRFIMGEREKEYFVNLMRKLAAFSGLRILTYCVMSNNTSTSSCRCPAVSRYPIGSYSNACGHYIRPAVWHRLHSNSRSTDMRVIMRRLNGSRRRIPTACTTSRHTSRL